MVREIPEIGSGKVPRHQWQWKKTNANYSCFMSEVKCPQRRLLAVFIEPCITFILPPSLERATVRVNSARLKSMRHHVWRMWGWILPPHASSMADHCHIWESGRRYHCQWLFTCLSVKCILFFWPCAEQINLLRSRGQQWILHAWIPPWIKFLFWF